MEYSRTIASLTLLSISSIQDIKKREIDDRVWMAFLAMAFLINVIEFSTGSLDPFGWVSFAALQSSAFILLYYAGVYGGADAKSLVCLSLMYPSSLNGFLADLSMGRLPVALSTLDNALMLTLLYLPLNLIWNIAMMANGVKLFEEMRENALRRFLALFLLRKIRVSSFSKDRFTLAERRTRGGSRRIVFSRGLEDKGDLRAFDEEDYVFASFLMPFQVMVLAGLIVRLLYGDILLFLSLFIVGHFIKIR